MEWLQKLTDNSEFVSGTANCLMALAWIYLFYRLTSISRSAFLFVAEVGVVLYFIYAIFVFNKEAKLSKVYDKAVLQPLASIDVEAQSKTIVDSFVAVFGWVFSKLPAQQ